MSVAVPVAASHERVSDEARVVDAHGDHRVRRRMLLIAGLVVSVVVLAVVTVLSIAYGSKPIPVGTVFRAFTDFDGSNDHLIVRSLRVPRTAVGLLAGACLGLSGAIMQGLTRNPLADPGLLGVDAGAALAVVIGIYVFDIGSLLGYVWFSYAGALVASLVVYALGSAGRTGATPVKIALAGAAMTALLGSFTSAILLLDTETLDQFRFWNVGSIAGRDGDIARQIAPFAVVAIAVSLCTWRALDTLALGEDVARSLGASVGRNRALCAIAIVLTAGTATAACGPIGFVGLVIPHMVRKFTGPSHRWLLPYSMILAPILLLGSDIVGRVIARPSEVQVGIVTALVGAPFFVVLARRTRLANL
ncbi:MAG TPA: iron ABC transporter permease [Ilumatobacteraceae bacterium]|nr:iron ABC transporter permease [Ilumatobacteraceae bacterium]